MTSEWDTTRFRMTTLRQALLLCVAAIACRDAPRPAMPDGVDFHVTPLSIRTSDLERLGPLRLRGAVAMQSRNASFGSYSGLDVSEDGRRLVANRVGKLVRRTSPAWADG